MNKDLYFECVEEFVDYIVEKVDNDNDLFLTIVGKFEEIKEILKEVMRYEFVNFDSLQIESPIMDDYYDEFVISLWVGDGVLEIGCEKLKNEDGEYTNPCGDIVYLFSNCSSKIIPLCENSDLFFVDVEDECDCDEECCCCECDCCNGNVFVKCSTDENGDTHGFAVNKSDDNGCYSFSYYANNKLTKEDICSILEEYGF